MPKIIPPPQITSLPEVIAVLTDPKKYAELAQQLQTMLDAINERLGALAEKEKMEEWIASSEQRQALAKEEASKLTHEAEDQKRQAEAVRAEAQVELTRAEEVRKDLETKRAALADIGLQRAATEEYATRLAARAKDLEEREEKLKDNYRRLEQLETLLQQRKNALDMEDLRLRDALKRVEV